MARTIQINNTLTRRKETLQPLEPGKIKMYACGVTVYDHCHLGHAMQAAFFDVIRRYLEYAGYEVTYVRNFTDVDDKIIQRASERGIPPIKLSADMIDSTNRDLAACGIREATHQPRVSEMIPEIIGMVKDLVDKGAAYATQDGDVYYRVRAKSDYGKLSGRRPDDMRSGTRDLVGGAKEDELDFALWKKDTTEGASWESPWGKGRPGWHIECSVMAKHYLGKHFDIHGGGRDLIFPHHENEIAQSEAANDAPFANYWIHNGLLTINHEKMSKSLGNHITIADALRRFPAEVLRFGILRNNYTATVDFSESIFRLCQRRLLYYYETLAALDELAQKGDANSKPLPDYKSDDIREAFHKAMSDDFGTASAIAELNAYFKRGNVLASGKKNPITGVTAKQWSAALREVGAVLGLFQESPQAFISGMKERILKEINVSVEEIQTAIRERQEARAAKDFPRSDKIRQDMAARGIEFMDKPTGTEWTIRFTDTNE
jgi:cysteinyl-tRNA synthetase